MNEWEKPNNSCVHITCKFLDRLMTRQVIAAVKIYIKILWFIKKCRLENCYQSFERIYCINVLAPELFF